MEQATVLRALFNRPEDSAAAHMVRDTLTVRPNMTVSEAVARCWGRNESRFLNLVDWQHEMPVVAADTGIQSVLFGMVFPQQIGACRPGAGGRKRRAATA
nr:hypothetical protein [Mycobacterium interjectum]